MSGEITSFRDLIAWQKAMRLCKEIYSLSALFPDAERFGLTSQIRRAVVSIPSNIAEGYARNRKNDYLRFLDIARGSLSEVETQLLLVKEFGWLSYTALQAEGRQLTECLNLVQEVARILYSLTKAVEASST